ncbi:MAG: STAS domain-containing protein [Sedimentisphaerales bacterium]|nr:STAS domain-containing protein [Sedimentisphaerales bacterium]
MAPTPKILIKNAGSITVLELLDEEILDEATINNISDSLLSLIHERPQIHLVVSFVRVKHLSSMALGMLIRLNKKIEEGKGTLKLCDIKPSLQEIFHITKLDKLFEIYVTCEMALNSYAV